MRRMLERAGRRVLLHHGDEREPRPALAAARARRKACCAACTGCRCSAPLAPAVPRCVLVGSGAILHEVIDGGAVLADDTGRCRPTSSASPASASWRARARRWSARRVLGGDADAPAMGDAGAGTTPGPHRRRHRLRARGARTAARLGARGPALRHAGHRRLRPQRQPRRSCATSSRSARATSCCAPCRRWPTTAPWTPPLPAAARARYGLYAGPDPWTV